MDQDATYSSRTIVWVYVERGILSLMSRRVQGGLDHLPALQSLDDHALHLLPPATEETEVLVYNSKFSTDAFEVAWESQHRWLWNCCANKFLQWLKWCDLVRKEISCWAVVSASLYVTLWWIQRMAPAKCPVLYLVHFSQSHGFHFPVCSMSFCYSVILTPPNRLFFSSLGFYVPSCGF